MFDRRLRDKLLFEDKHFTYIRRYFWAYNTLAVINTGIAAMIAAYIGAFTEDFWDGSHPLLWPHPNPDSADGAAYAEKMGLLRRELDKVVADLGDVQKRNERTRKEIENLRDQLFSGSSIKESRRAIDQGDNIQILTMISMIFLPLTFVTVRLYKSNFSFSCGTTLLTFWIAAVRLWHYRIHNPSDRLALRDYHGLGMRALHDCHLSPPNARVYISRSYNKEPRHYASFTPAASRISRECASSGSIAVPAR